LASEPWKILEGSVAKILGGVRIHRGADFSQSLPDVVADVAINNIKYRLIVECKYRNSVSWPRYVFSLMREIGSNSAYYPAPNYEGGLIVFNMKNIYEEMEKATETGEVRQVFIPKGKIPRVVPQFLLEAVDQAASYRGARQVDDILGSTKFDHLRFFAAFRNKNSRDILGVTTPENFRW
jgi:hypothetical protein